MANARGSYPKGASGDKASAEDGREGAVLVREVLEPGRVAAHVGLELGAGGRVRDHLVPQLIEQAMDMGRKYVADNWLDLKHFLRV